MQLDKHPILWQGYHVTQAIEMCGASTELTHAVTLQCALMEEVEKLVDELAACKKKVEIAVPYKDEHSMK